jgi:hypothetical protein
MRARGAEEREARRMRTQGLVGCQTSNESDLSGSTTHDPRTHSHTLGQRHPTISESRNRTIVWQGCNY